MYVLQIEYTILVSLSIYCLIILVGKLVVSCEGYSHKDDPFVLVGSCGLRYGLEYENGAKQQSTKTQHQRQYYDNTQYDSGMNLNLIFILSKIVSTSV